MSYNGDRYETAVVFEKIACTEPGCNLVAKVSERIGTTCRYFEYCPACGSKGSLNQWQVAYVDGIEKQYINGGIV